MAATVVLVEKVEGAGRRPRRSGGGCGGEARYGVGVIVAAAIAVMRFSAAAAAAGMAGIICCRVSR